MTRRTMVNAKSTFINYGPNQRLHLKRSDNHSFLPSIKRYTSEIQDTPKPRSELLKFIDVLTAQTQTALLQSVKSFDTKDKRKVYSIIRAQESNIDENTFLGNYGLTAGQYAIFDLLARNPQRQVNVTEALEVVTKPVQKRKK